MVPKSVQIYSNPKNFESHPINANVALEKASNCINKNVCTCRKTMTITNTFKWMVI